MTTPKDPNQPGWAAPPEANQPAQAGWGQPPAQPGWGAPPAQPGWGQPPAQPGWGAPPAQPGWGQPPAQPGWGQPGWNAAPPAKKGHGCLIAFLIVLVVALVGVGGCVYLVATTVGPALSTALTIQSNSGGQITSVNYNWDNGVGTFRIVVASGVTQAQARDLACRVVKPALKGTQFENTRFVIYSPYGDRLADETTPCT